MKETYITGIFPTPIYITKLNTDFSKKESLFFEKIKKDCYKNIGNITSNNTYILNEKNLKNLKNKLNFIIKDYFNKIISPSNKLIPYITQSWLNFTKNNEYHHKHEHPNSLVSGVLYINADKNNDKIMFYKNEYHTILPEVKSFNLFNSSNWWFPVETGNIILFPSSLSHSVEIKQGDNVRISLAFNVFIKGKIGDNKKLTELVL
jgi:uncharacterized protein (TIGR02466 family)